MVTGYRMREHEDDEGTPVTRIEPRSLMAPPGIPDFLTRRRFLAPGPVRIEGRAWSGWGPIERVEVSTDGGASWQSARAGRPARSGRVGAVVVRVGRARGRARAVRPRARRDRPRPARRAAVERRRLLRTTPSSACPSPSARERLEQVGAGAHVRGILRVLLAPDGRQHGLGVGPAADTAARRAPAPRQAGRCGARRIRPGCGSSSNPGHGLRSSAPVSYSRSPTMPAGSIASQPSAPERSTLSWCRSPCRTTGSPIESHSSAYSPAARSSPASSSPQSRTVSNRWSAGAGRHSAAITPAAAAVAASSSTATRSRSAVPGSARSSSIAPRTRSEASTRTQPWPENHSSAASSSRGFGASLRTAAVPSRVRTGST